MPIADGGVAAAVSLLKADIQIKVHQPMRDFIDVIPPTLVENPGTKGS
jgi:hypothetical protein